MIQLMKFLSFWFLILTFNINVLLGECMVHTWNKTQILRRPDSSMHQNRMKNPDYADFWIMIENSAIWVDKSLLIEEIIKSSYSVFMIVGPLRWGKSINLSMLAKYFGLQLNEDGTPVMDRQHTENYEYFVNGNVFAQGIKYEVTPGPPLISKYKNNDLHLGKYPIIYFEASTLSVEYGIESLREMIWESYMMHDKFYQLLKNSNDTASFDLFDSYFNRDRIHKLLDVSIINAFKILSMLLHKFYKERVIILFDEHDGYVRTAYFSQDTRYNSTSESNTNFTNVYYNLMRKTFKHNPYLYKAIITGVLRFYETTQVSAINHMKFINVFEENDFYPYYGLYGPEFYKLGEVVGLDTSEMDSITNFYEGYHSLANMDIPIYCPYSVSSCIAHYRIDYYWPLSFVHSLLKPLLRHHKDFAEDIVTLLLEFKTKESSIYTLKEKFLRFDLDDCQIMNDLQQNVVRYNRDYHQIVVFSFLLSTGIVSTHPIFKSSSPEHIMLRIPNQEIWNYLNIFTLGTLSMNFQKLIENSIPYIQKYVLDNDDSFTLNPMTQAIAKFLFNAADEQQFIFGTEKGIESMSRLMFQNALQTAQGQRATASSSGLFKLGKQMSHCLEDMNTPYIDLIYMFDNVMSIIIKIKYSKRPKRRNSEDNLLNDAFAQCLSYSAFYRGYNVSGFEHYKFLAVSISDLVKVDTVSLTITASELEQLMKLSENKLNKRKNSEDTKKKNYNIWLENMYDEAFRKHGSQIFRARFENPQSTTESYDESNTLPCRPSKPSKRKSTKSVATRLHHILPSPIF